ncbi:MAG: type IV pilus biogenesis/stability protein PilW [Legionellales bacterium]
MFKALRNLLLLSCCMLQGCPHPDTASASKTEPVSKKPDLIKAATYNVQLGLGYLKQGDRPRAKKKLLLALDQAPGSPDVNAAIAYYFEQTSELDQAKKYYLKAVTLSANSGAQLNNYGTFLCRQGDYQKAETYFLKAVKDLHYLNTSGAYENAGLCSLAIPDKDKAKHYFGAALGQDPSRKQSLYELVLLESKAGNDGEALKQLEKHPDLVLNDPAFLELAKDLANKTGNATLAAQYETNFRNMGSNTDNSGEKNEYNNHNG